jgi:REP element-mobilizing transposase RayT
VFSTRERQRSIAVEWRDDLHAYIGGIIRGQGGVAVAVGGVSDHIHILLGLKPAHRLSDVMREIKHESSHWVRETKRMRTFSWQKGYGVFTVSPLGCERVREYVLSQSRRHRDP